MAARYFTPEEANALLDDVRPVSERLVAHRRAMAVMAARRARYVQRIAGNGGDFDPQDQPTPGGGSDARARPVAPAVAHPEDPARVGRDPAPAPAAFPA